MINKIGALHFYWVGILGILPLDICMGYIMKCAVLYSKDAIYDIGYLHIGLFMLFIS